VGEWTRPSGRGEAEKVECDKEGSVGVVRRRGWNEIGVEKERRAGIDVGGGAEMGTSETCRGRKGYEQRRWSGAEMGWD
jgi:hypothetical protein